MGFAPAAIPVEDRPPLPIDADRVEAVEVAARLLEVVARRRPQIAIGHRVVDHLETAKQPALDVGGNIARCLVIHEEGAQPSVSKAGDRGPLPGWSYVPLYGTKRNRDDTGQSGEGSCECPDKLVDTESRFRATSPAADGIYIFESTFRFRRRPSSALRAPSPPIRGEKGRNCCAAKTLPFSLALRGGEGARRADEGLLAARPHLRSRCDARRRYNRAKRQPSASAFRMDDYGMRFRASRRCIDATRHFQRWRLAGTPLIRPSGTFSPDDGGEGSRRLSPTSVAAGRCSRRTGAPSSPRRRQSAPGISPALPCLAGTAAPSPASAPRCSRRR